MKTPTVSLTKPTPPRASPRQARLLYRGALSLPDSYLLLDGLTFFTRAGASDPRDTLLQNPLALSLEIMRGRPSLRFMGTVEMQNIFTDESAAIEVDVHPAAALTRAFFENTFCLAGAATKSEYGIRVSLGDSDNETTQMVIFAQSTGSATPLILLVERILPGAPSSSRLPRPDDHMPRKPPLCFETSIKTRELKRTSSSAQINPSSSRTAASKRQKLSSTTLPPNDIIKLDSMFGLPDHSGDPFLGKGKSLTSKPGKGKQRATETRALDEDVFGDPSLAATSSKMKDKKAKATPTETAIERENRNVIKKSAVHYLTSGFRSGGVETPAIAKNHPDFKDIFGWVYRGSAFALRSQIRDEPLDTDVIEKVVKSHVGLYMT